MNQNSEQRLVVLLSGRGSNYQALQQARSDGRMPGEITGVISDRIGAAGLDKARADGVDTICIARSRYPDQASFELALDRSLEALRPDWIVLAGFMRILSADFVRRQSGHMVNIHPSLLPRHRGLHTHQRALDAGDKRHGASVHFVTAELDGGPVISQVRMPIEPEDDADRLAERLLPLEHRLLPATMALLMRYPVELRDEQIFFENQALDQPLQLGFDLADDGRLAGRGRNA